MRHRGGYVAAADSAAVAMNLNEYRSDHTP